MLMTQQISIADTQSIKPCPQCGTGVKFKVDTSSNRRSCPHCGYILPNQVAHFKLLHIIGSGGMGAVYLGLDTSLERNVAVKIMREEFAKNQQFVDSFLREARAAAALNHPNVAQIYSFGQQNARYYLVMELLPFGSLDDRIEKEKRLPELDVLDVGMQVASGLRAAHEKNLIHRDIKPGNILFAQDGTAKVVDFGLAIFDSKTAGAPQEEGIWGTPYYIAPEKVLGNPGDHRSDIYSLGGTLFHALAGRAPFEAGTSTEVVLKHLHSPAVSLHAFAPDCTLQTTEVIGRMLKRDPAERHQNYEELLNDLAYAKRFAQQKRPPEKIEVQSEFSTGALVSTILLILALIGIGIGTWKYRDKFLSEPSTNRVQTPLPATNQTNRTVLTPPNQLPQKPPTPPVQKSPLDFAAEIKSAHDILSGGRDKLKDAMNRFVSIQKKLPPGDSKQRRWIDLYLARMSVINSLMLKQPQPPDAQQKNLEEAKKSLDLLAGKISADSMKTFSSPEEYEEKYAEISATVLNGKMSGRGFGEALPKMPAWMQISALFDAGLTALRNDQLSESVRYWQEYSKSCKKFENAADLEQPWVLSYQAVARDAVEEVRHFESVKGKADRLKSESRLREIKDLLEKEVINAAWKMPVTSRLVSAIRDENDQAINKQEREQEESRKAEHAQQVEFEKKLVDEMLAVKASLQSSYQFEQLLEGWKKLDPKVKTDENRKIVQFNIDVTQCLANYKESLVRDVQVHPYDREELVTRSNRKMIGKLHKIEGDKLLFRQSTGTGGSIETSCVWSELPAGAVIKLGEFYLKRIEQIPEPNNSELARRVIALAVLAREYKVPNSESYIKTCLNYAGRTGADIKDAIEKLFPHVFPL